MANAIFLFALAIAGLLMPLQAAVGASVIETAPLATRIDGRTYKLDAMIAHPDGPGPWPVALLAHGSAPGNPRQANLTWLSGWAHDMASRGWLAVAVMRRGYGASEGEVSDDAGSCASPDIGRYLEAHADDLQAALDAVRGRADVDASRILVIGDSAGGAASLAFAARQPTGLVGVISVSGGLAKTEGPFKPSPNCDAYTADLVWNFARFGTTVRAPTQWIYSENDGLFRPGVVARLRSAFAASGGKVSLAMLPTFQNDGHRLFFTDQGRQLILPLMDAFLREQHLPTWDEAAFTILAASATPSNRRSLQTYFAALPTEKALAMDNAGHLYWREGRDGERDARRGVLDYCTREGGKNCRLLAVDFDLVAAADLCDAKRKVAPQPRSDSSLVGAGAKSGSGTE